VIGSCSKDIGEDKKDMHARESGKVGLFEFNSKRIGVVMCRTRTRR
jgi:hypothetical protein